MQTVSRFTPETAPIAARLTVGRARLAARLRPTVIKSKRTSVETFSIVEVIASKTEGTLGLGDALGAPE